MTQVYVVAVSQLNDSGIRPNGGEIKPWIRQEISDHGITADPMEVATVLTGLLHQQAISQEEFNQFMQRHAKVKI